MQIISQLEEFEAPWDGCVLTLGDFDGMHRGHRKLIDSTLKHAKKLNLPAVVVTYHPSPKKVLKKLSTDSKIYTRDEKIILLRQYPLRATVFIPFTLELAKMKASDFLQKILLEKMKARHIIIGHDHCFGYSRKGNFEYLKLASRKNNYYVNQIKAVRANRETVSSTKIRDYLKEGRIKKANNLLDYPYIISSTVILGKQRGRLLGVPTANLHIHPEKLIPKAGVYYCIAQYGANKYKAVVNIGFNPTFKNVDISVEAHLIGFDQDIYGENLKLFFLERIRDEKKFENIDQLKAQIFIDIDKVKKKKTPSF